MKDQLMKPKVWLIIVALMHLFMGVIGAYIQMGTIENLSIMIYLGALILNRMIFLMITTLRRYLNGGRILTQFFMQAVHNFLAMGSLQIT